MKSNFPTKLADQQLDQFANQSNETCFECGKPGHRKVECPHLKPGLRAAAIRTEDSDELRPEPTLLQINEEEDEPQNI